MIMAEGVPETSRFVTHGEYELRGYKGPEYAYHGPSFLHVAKQMFADVFHLNPDEAAKEVASNIRSGGSIVLATHRPSGEIVAYSTQRILQPPFESGVRIMLTTTRLVLPEHWGNQLGPDMMRFAHILHDAPDVSAGRTQDPRVPRLYQKSGLLTGVYPFDKSYKDSPRMQRVLEYVADQMRPKRAVDLDTGLTKEIYGEGASRAYDNTVAPPELQAFYARMINEFGMNPEQGDALVIMGVKRGRTNFVE